MISDILGIIKKFIPDKDAAAKAAVELESQLTKQMSLQADVIKAEANSGGITAKWRPWTMVVFVAMVVVHFVLYDIVPWCVVTFDLDVITPQDPGFTDGLLDLIKIGIGGYIGGRTVEHCVSLFKTGSRK